MPKYIIMILTEELRERLSKINFQMVSGNMTRIFSHKELLLKILPKNINFRPKAKYAYDYTHYVARDTTNILGETVTEGAQSDDSYYQQEYYFSAVNMYSILPNWDVSLIYRFSVQQIKCNQKRNKYPIFFSATLYSIVFFGKFLQIWWF